MDIFHFRTHECGEPHSKLFLVEPKIFADSWYKTILTLHYWIHFVGLVRDLGMIRLTCTKCHPVVSDRNGSKCQGAASVTDWSHCLQSRLDIYIYIYCNYIYTGLSENGIYPQWWQFIEWDIWWLTVMDLGRRHIRRSHIYIIDW